MELNTVCDILSLHGQMHFLIAKINILADSFVLAHNKKNNHWSDQAEFYTLAHNTQKLSSFTTFPYEMVAKEKPRVPRGFNLEAARDQHQVCTSQFLNFLPTLSTILHHTKIQLSNFF